MFPNVLSVDEVAEDYTYVPWTKIVAGLAILILLLIIWRRYVRWKNRRAANRQAKLEAERTELARREAETN